MTRRTVLAVVVALLAGGAGTSLGRRVFVLPTGYRLQLEGYLGSPPEGRREEADLVVRCQGKDQRFQVTKGRLLTGDMLIADVFARVRPYTPQFVLRGPAELLKRFAEAHTGDRLRLMGQWRPGTRDLLVGSIELLTSE